MKYYKGTEVFFFADLTGPSPGELTINTSGQNLRVYSRFIHVVAAERLWALWKRAYNLGDTHSD